MMTVPLLDLQAQYASIKDEVMTKLWEVVESQRFIMGASVQELERDIAAFTGARHGIGCASGTDALLLSLKTLDLQPGDEVITSPFTFFATAGAIVNAGGTPVFADVDRDTLNLDPAATAAAMTPRTRCLLPVHLFGQMAPMEAFVEITRRHGAEIFEDAAQAIGARRCIAGEWRTVGATSMGAALSFFPSKNLGGWGDGGMIITNDDARAARLRLLRLHGGAKQYHHDEVGYNSRLDTIQAAVLLVKLRHLDDWNRRRRAHAAVYTEAFEGIDGLETVRVDPANEHVFHQYTIRSPRRDALREHLTAQGIGCAVYYPKPLHLQPCFAHLGCREGQFPVSEAAAHEVLSLPIYPELSEDQRDRVIDVVRGFFV